MVQSQGFSARTPARPRLSDMTDLSHHSRVCLIWDMSESAGVVNRFFIRRCIRIRLPDTLQATGAEDKALLGSNLSADSGAETRLGPAS
jgi:hypothetical protein